jgi:hypothetical protein
MRSLLLTWTLAGERIIQGACHGRKRWCLSNNGLLFQLAAKHLHGWRPLRSAQLSVLPLLCLSLLMNGVLAQLAARAPMPGTLLVGPIHYPPCM